jgi:dihydrofolate synthase/folylpolyglutamate synthase
VGWESAVSYLDSLGVDAMKSMAPSLKRIEAICEALDHPEDSLQAIHITGTNGKTSTARIATRVLASAGLSVGTYTSPHLQTIRERISLNGVPISEDDFGDVFDHVGPFASAVQADLGEGLTYFEILTAMFFMWAAEQPVDAAVVEVGLGGRWDATNVITAPVAVITNVGLDHTGLLGMERTQIAREKAGIIKADAVAVTGERAPDVLAVLGAEADRVDARMSTIDRDFAVADNRVALGGRYLSLRTGARSYEELFLSLHGAHQGVNAAVALEAATRFIPARELDETVVAEAFASTFVAGRLESIKLNGGETRTVVLDVAHNPDGASALVTSLAEAFAFERVVFVVGILADKDYRGMLAELARLECSLFFTEAKTVRSVPADELRVAADELALPSEVIDDVAKATDAAIDSAGRGELVCITGSHYVVGEARTHLRGTPAPGLPGRVGE